MLIAGIVLAVVGILTPRWWEIVLGIVLVVSGGVQLLRTPLASARTRHR